VCTHYQNIDDTIHFVILYKMIIRRFIVHYQYKYMKIIAFSNKFKVENNFHISIKKGHVIELCKSRTLQSNSKKHVPCLHYNALQRKLQSRG
jgi:ribosomal protein S17